MLPVAAQVPVAGLYSSAVNAAQQPALPAASTCPLGSSVAVCSVRATVMLPVGVHAPVAGLYSSALAKMGHEPFTQVPSPPATSTWPSCSSVAVWPARTVVMLPVAAQVPVAGLNSSALLVAAPPS